MKSLMRHIAGHIWGGGNEQIWGRQSGKLPPEQPPDLPVALRPVQQYVVHHLENEE